MGLSDKSTRLELVEDAECEEGPGEFRVSSFMLESFLPSCAAELKVCIRLFALPYDLSV